MFEYQAKKTKISLNEFGVHVFSELHLLQPSKDRNEFYSYGLLYVGRGLKPEFENNKCYGYAELLDSKISISLRIPDQNFDALISCLNLRPISKIQFNSDRFRENYPDNQIGFSKWHENSDKIVPLSSYNFFFDVDARSPSNFIPVIGGLGYLRTESNLND